MVGVGMKKWKVVCFGRTVESWTVELIMLKGEKQLRIEFCLQISE